MKRKRKTNRKIKDTGKAYPKINQREFGKALGTEIVTDPKEIANYRKKFPKRP